jgi:hypothetical protein
MTGELNARLSKDGKFITISDERILRDNKNRLNIKTYFKDSDLYLGISLNLS